VDPSPLDAKKLQRSEAALLREAVERYLPDSESGHGDVQEDPLFRIVGVGEGASDLSERVDDVLYGSGA
jgi:hypothetical protein